MQVELAEQLLRNFEMECVLPDEIVHGALFEGNEYAWRVDAFSAATRSAPALEYACLGGQFQFRLGTQGTYEMYWLDADSDQRFTDEAWPHFANVSVPRSCRSLNAD